MISFSAREPFDLDPAYVVGPTRFGRLFKKQGEAARKWGQRRLKEWWEDQCRGGPVRVFQKRSGGLYTTMSIISMYFPNATVDVRLERRLRTIERELDNALSRLAEIEIRMGRRR